MGTVLFGPDGAGENRPFLALGPEITVKALSHWEIQDIADCIVI